MMFKFLAAIIQAIRNYKYDGGREKRKRQMADELYEQHPELFDRASIIHDGEVYRVGPNDDKPKRKEKPKNHDDLPPPPPSALSIENIKNAQGPYQ